MRLLVAEMFGPTFQGEGPSSGQQAVFVRLSRCNLHCPGCDTPYTWDWSRFDRRREATIRPPAEVAAWVLAQRPGLVVITGGEPLLQQRALVPLVERLAATGRRVEVETNGTVVPDGALVAAVSAFNVSPKLPSFAAMRDKPVNDRALRVFAGCGKAVFKFVVTGPQDLPHVQALEETYHLSPVWIMPAATTSGEVLDGMRAVAEAALRHGWNLTGRQHLLLWEDTRGR
jgi:organic radical activating enzyme